MMLLKSQSGFTLIELAIVLFVVGLMLGGFLGPLSTSIELEQRAVLDNDYDEIDDALIGFVIANGRFPCPDCPDAATGTCVAADIDDGLEDRAGGVCKAGVTTTIEGNLPWVTLGVTGTDPWGSTLQYAVETNYADSTDGDGCTPVTAGISFSLCSAATIIIQDQGDACPVVPPHNPAPSNVATGVPALVYSQGANFATSSCYETENTDGDAVFVYKAYSTDDDLYYDDMLLWISPHVLNSKMVKAEILP